MSPRGGAESKTVVLIGSFGHGKRATGNTIIGRQGFDSMPSSGGFALTSTCQLETTILDDSQILNVIDTSGILDSSVGKYEMAKGIVECINMGKDGIHAFLVVSSLRIRSSEEAFALETLCQIFGSKIADYMIVVFTDSNIFGRPCYLEDFHMYPQISKILKLCGNRFVIFENKTEDEVKISGQRKQLLSLVETVVERNGGIPYMNDLLYVLKIREMNMIDQSSEGKSSEGTFHGMNEEQFDRITEMLFNKVELRLSARILNLENQLAEKSSKQVQDRLHRVEKQLAEEIAARMEALSVQTKSKDEVLELKECLYRAEESHKLLEKRLCRVERVLEDVRLSYV